MGLGATRACARRLACLVGVLDGLGKQERGVLDALDGQVAQIVEGQPDPPWILVATASRPAPHRGHFQIDQRRCGELLAAQPVPHRVAVRVIIHKGDGQDAGVNDEHGRTATRSPRPASAPMEACCVRLLVVIDPFARLAKARAEVSGVVAHNSAAALRGWLSWAARPRHRKGRERLKRGPSPRGGAMDPQAGGTTHTPSTRRSRKPSQGGCILVVARHSWVRSGCGFLGEWVYASVARHQARGT